MLALSFTFLAGRYHATPWYRHVNEGAVAWPPEPLRILRGLIATWHHKVKPSRRYDEATVQGLIEALARELPQYGLPQASHSHTRHYMPQFTTAKIVFDAFAAVRPTDALTVVWPNVELPGDQLELLDEILAVMGYLGRAESWVEARRLSRAPEVNCIPGEDEIDFATGELKGEIISLSAPLPAEEYQELRRRFLADTKAAKKLASTLPENLLDALSIDTEALRKQGWSQPPSARKVNYIRPVDALRPQYSTPTLPVPSATSINFILAGKPLPRVEDTLYIGELMRASVMSRAKHRYGEHHIPAVLSGHNMPPDNRHRHAFYLPWDSNRDGRLDRILVYVPDGMTGAMQQVVQSVKWLRSRHGGEWRLIVESVGVADVAKQLTGCSAIWESVTPYLHPWHVKKKFTVADQIQRECRERGLPMPAKMEMFGEVVVGRGRRLRPIHFRRFRSRRDLSQPDRLGSFWRVTFPEPVQGPLALGFGCHFGLGLFAPAE